PVAPAAPSPARRLTETLNVPPASAPRPTETVGEAPPAPAPRPTETVGEAPPAPAPRPTETTGVAPPPPAPAPRPTETTGVAPPSSPPAPAPLTAQAMPEMIALPAGTFAMGSNDDPSEKPIRHVTVQPFALSKYPITVREWKA